MANHASALKRIRQTATRRLLNKYKHKTTRNAIRELQALKDKKAASALLPKVVGMLDKPLGVSGADGSVLYNNGGAMGADADLNWNDSTNTLETKKLTVDGTDIDAKIWALS